MTETLLVPCEIINRDLDYGLFLATSYLRRRPDARVFIGRRDALGRVAAAARGGIYVGKIFEPFFPDVDFALYRLLKARGFAAVHLDDEGAVFHGEQDEWRRTLARRLDVTRLDRADAVCTWGDWQRDFYREQAPERASTIVTTGHPRFDLYRGPLRDYYEDDVAPLRARYGDFVLLNTNLSTANNGLGLSYSFSKRWGYDETDPAKRSFAVSYYAHTTKILVNFVSLIHRLAAELPELRFVVRPHPSESIEYYQTVFRGLPTVSVVHEGSVVPWLFACRALVHDGCTTGIEAAMGGVPVVNFKSVANARHDNWLPNQFGVRCETEDEVIAQVRRVGPATQRTVDGDPSAPDLGRDLMRNFDQRALGSLLEVLDGARADGSGRRAVLDEPQLRARELAHSAREVAARGVRRLTPWRAGVGKYARAKFYGLRNADMERRLARMDALVGGRSRVETYSDFLAAVSSA